MSDAEELAKKERRRLLIKRLNEKEKLIGLQSPPRRDQMSEEELEGEIERQICLGEGVPLGSSYPASRLGLRDPPACCASGGGPLLRRGALYRIIGSAR